MTLLVIIVIHGLWKVLFRLSTSTWLVPQGVSYINPGGRGEVLRPLFLISSVLSFLLLLLFFFPPGLILGDFNVLELLKSLGFWFLRLLWLFVSCVFHWLALYTGLDCWWPTTSEVVLIGVLNIEAGPKGGLGLDVNCFLDNLLKAIEFLAALFYFDSY